MDRAGRYLGILVIPRYGNQMICVSSKFLCNDIIAFSITAVLPCLETLLRPEICISYTTEDKSLVNAKPNQQKRLKHPNSTVNPQAFCKNRNK